MDSWEIADDPKYEHSKRNPNCPYLVTGGVYGYPAYECAFGSVFLEDATVEMDAARKPMDLDLLEEPKSSIDDDFSFANTIPDKILIPSKNETETRGSSDVPKSTISQNSDTSKDRKGKSLLKRKKLKEERKAEMYFDDEPSLEEKTKKRKLDILEKVESLKQQETMLKPKSQQRIAHSPNRENIDSNFLKRNRLVRKEQEIFTVGDYIKQLKEKQIERIEEKYQEQMFLFKEKMKVASVKLETNLRRVSDAAFQ